MPIFDVKRCKAWIATNYAMMGYASFEDALSSWDAGVTCYAPTTECIAMRHLCGIEAFPHPEVHDLSQCGYCRRMLRYGFFCYSTRREFEPYLQAIALLRNITMAELGRIIANGALCDEDACFSAGEEIGFETLPKDRQYHRVECEACDLWQELWEKMEVPELGRQT